MLFLRKENILEEDELTMDLEAGKVYKSGIEIPLTPIEYGYPQVTLG